MLGINSAVTLNTKKQEVAYGIVRIEENSFNEFSSATAAMRVSISITWHYLAGFLAFGKTLLWV